MSYTPVPTPDRDVKAENPYVAPCDEGRPFAVSRLPILRTIRELLKSLVLLAVGILFASWLLVVLVVIYFAVLGPFGFPIMPRPS